MSENIGSMLFMRKGLTIFFTAVFFLLPFIGHAQNQNTSFKNATPIEIGAIFNLTGTESPLDIPSAQGAKLAVHEINQQGGILGHPLHLIIKNAQTNYKTTEKIATEFAKDPKISVVIGLNSTDFVLKAAPILAKVHKLFISTGATSAELTQLVPKYLFLTCFDNRVQAAAAAEYAYRFLDYSTAGIIYDDSLIYTKRIAHYFRDSFLHEKGQILLTEKFSHADCNFKTDHCDIQKLVKALHQLKTPPQCIYLAVGPTEAGIMIKELRNAGYHGAIIGSDTYDSDLILKLAGKSADNVSYMTHGVINTEFSQLLPALMRQYLATLKFIKLYQDYYHHDPKSVFAALGYDAISLVNAAINQSNGFTSKDILNGLHDLDNFVGVTGKLDYVDRQTVPIKTVSIIRIENSKARFLGNWIPSSLPVTHDENLKPIGGKSEVASENKARQF